MYTLFWLLAVIVVVAGVAVVLRGRLAWGIGLIVVGLAVGPWGALITR